MLVAFEPARRLFFGSVKQREGRGINSPRAAGKGIFLRVVKSFPSFFFYFLSCGGGKESIIYRRIMIIRYDCFIFFSLFERDGLMIAARMKGFGERRFFTNIGEGIKINGSNKKSVSLKLERFTNL